MIHFQRQLNLTIAIPSLVPYFDVLLIKRFCWMGCKQKQHSMFRWFGVVLRRMEHKGTWNSKLVIGYIHSARSGSRDHRTHSTRNQTNGSHRSPSVRHHQPTRKSGEFLFAFGNVLLRQHGTSKDEWSKLSVIQKLSWCVSCTRQYAT